MNHVKVWNVTRKIDGQVVRVATIEQGRRKPAMCEGCSAPCCKGPLQPVLTQEEFLSRKFKMAFIEVPLWLQVQAPRAQRLAVIAVGPRGCPYLDHVINRCTIWPDCPESCLAYDCREETREPIRSFALTRAAELEGRRNGRLRSD